MPNPQLLSRRVSSYDNNGERIITDQTQILDHGSPIVILGEPGIGKTTLLQTLAQHEGLKFIRAAKFLRESSSKLVDGSMLVIDALDEVSSIREGDPLHHVLAKLEELDRPPFILSCRSADWNGRLASQDILEDYFTEAKELTLEPLSDLEAADFLKGFIGARAADTFLYALRDNGMGDLSTNPMTLQMLASIAEDGIPEDRADLYERATEKLRQEHNPRHRQSKLSKLSSDQALDAAGMMSAILLLSGKDSIAKHAPSKSDENDISIAELSELGNSETMEAVLGSRLFRSAEGGDNRFVPIHKTVAEYSGARWLAKAVEDKRSAKRLFALFKSDNRIPASLRGLHVWLSNFRDDFASLVVQSDPYGLIRYAETKNLNIDLSRQLLASLERLSETDPYFRAGDWGRYPIHCFNRPELVEDFRGAIMDENHKFHLRGLLLEALYDSDVIAALAPDLEASVRNTNLVFRERSDAGSALAQNPDCTDWPKLVTDLVKLGDESSTRLAVELVRKAGFSLFSDAEIASALLTECGFFLSRSEGERRNRTIGTFITLENALPDDRIVGILNALAEAIREYRKKQGEKSDERGYHRSEFNRFVRRLIVRQLRLSPPKPEVLWKWLNTLETEYGGQDDARSAIAEFFGENDDFRQAVQHHVMLTPEGEASRQGRHWHMARLSRGLCLNDADVIKLLEEVVRLSPSDNMAREIWKMLVSASRNDRIVPDDVRRLAEPFADGDQELLDWIDPPPKEPADWEREEDEWEAERQAEKQKKLDQWEDDRKYYLENIANLRRGDLATVSPAKAYLGHHFDIDNDLEPVERVEQWLGAEVTQAAIEGFENVLYRTDLPSGREIAEKHSQNIVLNFAFPICVGLSRKIQNGEPLDDIDIKVLEAGRIGQHCNLNVVDKSTDQLGSTLDKILMQDAEIFEAFARNLLEPQFENNASYIVGIYQIVRQRKQQAVAIKLASEWLDKYPNLSDEVVRDLVACLCNAEGGIRESVWESLSELAANKLKENLEEDDLNYWLSVYFLVDFEAALILISDDKIIDLGFFWKIRDILIPDRFDESENRYVSPEQASWVIRKFRSQWPHCERPGGTTGGSKNPWNASDFISAMIYRLASFDAPTASQYLKELDDEVADEYSASLKNAAARQLQRRAETGFEPAGLSEVIAVVSDQKPETARDVQAVVLAEIDSLQERLHGASTDPTDGFYDNGVPKTEPKCRNAMLNLMAHQMPHGIHWSPEEAMPKGTFADTGFRCGALVVPLEAKGQWHKEVWVSAKDQLKDKYMIDHRSHGCGIYVVFWFGEQSEHPNKQPYPPPSGTAIPKNAQEMQDILEGMLDSGDTNNIIIRVLDVSR